MQNIIDELKKINYELPEDYNSPAYYDNLLKNLYDAVEPSKEILINNSKTENYSRFKERLNKIVKESTEMNANFYDYPLESKMELVRAINEEFEYLNSILEAYFIRLGKLNEFWRYDYNKQDIYRAMRHQLLINPEDGSLLPINEGVQYTD